MASNRLLKSSGGVIRAVLIDLSGTLHVGDDEIPGAIDAVKR